MPRLLMGPLRVTTALDSLPAREVNYDVADAPEDGHPDARWHQDADDIDVGDEAPGQPVPGGPFEKACQISRQYEFAEARILRAAYRKNEDLLGRNMLLVGRFFVLRFYLGARITSVTDDTREGPGGPERVWGWSYQTLQGHLEQGRLSYEVIKNLGSGHIVFRVAGYSRRGPIANPVVRLGFTVFGRFMQRRFYAAVRRRLRDLVQAAERGEPLPEPEVLPGGIVIAPSTASHSPLERLAVALVHPGR